MSQRLFNSMTRTKEELVPLTPGKLSVYVCGVTPYDLSHVGHARAYVVFDTVVRWLRRSYEVTYVRNFTDVDDKIIARAHKAGVEPHALSEQFIAAYHEDMEALGVAKADLEPRVTTHIPEIVAFVAGLVEQGYAYRVKSGSSVDGAGDDVYFRVKKYEKYTELSGRHLDELCEGIRVSVDDRKEDPLDFALWKSAKPGEPAWDSPFGKGRPGWHIECSAMCAKHLGPTIDLHGGGRDLIFPHHTNEIAQSEARHEGKPLAKYWLHNGFVEIDSEKMSKSTGNFFTIRNVFEEFTAQALRTLLLGTHYRSPIQYSKELVEEAEKKLQYFYETRQRISTFVATTSAEWGGPGLKEIFSKPDKPFDPWQELVDGMNDDFNTPIAMAAFHELMRVANLLVAGREKEAGVTKLKPAVRARLLDEAAKLLVEMGSVLGVGADDPKPFLEQQRTRRLKAKGIAVETVQKLIDARAEGRARKDYEAADKARAELTALGIEVRDGPTGVEWSVL
jgi:cysteinyl-tRNA synthetase